MRTRLGTVGEKAAVDWKYLTARPGRRKQLFVMGTRLPAAQVWRSVVLNGSSVEDAAEDWDLPVDAVLECIRYAEVNQPLIQAENCVERAFVEGKGHRIEPPPAR